MKMWCACGYTVHDAEWSTIREFGYCPRCQNFPIFSHCKLALSALRFKYWCLDNGIDQDSLVSVTKPQEVNRGGRPKKHQSNAEKQREYRQRMKALRN
jgi:hypothetical protein